MTAPAVSDPAPGIPTLNLQDPADRARLPKRCPYCRGGGIIDHEKPCGSSSVGRTVCLACSQELADLVSYPPRKAIPAEEWTVRIGRKSVDQCPEHPYARLNHELVTEIRQMAAEGATSTEVARLYGLSRDAALRVMTRQTWKCVP